MVFGDNTHAAAMTKILAREMGIHVVEVQHHHSHIASCMAEHSLHEQVIGISFDGTGLGDDGNIYAWDARSWSQTGENGDDYSRCRLVCIFGPHLRAGGNNGYPG